ncbi:MAG: NAD(P)H-hydrate dehydratase [Vescimonas sp.]|uniref:NAD(P)H-hydrate dehydratase n=1 Tax=Vescimonas sp. TaxID=2892404 RepID=UPI002A90EBC3|nr:NAD(P)H-hydrate dehydratase [Vescimonas sp.]MDY5334654.1 NAD(P)H-hydrate dehydratase [Vescimonas sp.]
MRLIDREYVRSLMPRRDPAGHKGTFGKAYLLGGSVGYTGAPVLCAAAAERSGCGLVFLGVPESVWPAAAVKCWGAMPHPLPERDGRLSPDAEEEIRRRAAGCDAVAMGCGMGRGEESDLLIRRLLTLEKPLVLDADGINALEGHIDTLSRRTCATVLTPHDGELARIGGDMTAPREASAAAFAAAHGVYLVRKGHRTLVAAPDGRLAVNTTGNDGMAKGGSGDILTGLLTGLLAQGMEPFAACCAAVWLHGRAGDLAAEEKGRRGMTPLDIIEMLPYALKEVE